jgi:hypothetical protein
MWLHLTCIKEIEPYTHKFQRQGMFGNKGMWLSLSVCELHFFYTGTAPHYSTGQDGSFKMSTSLV